MKKIIVPIISAIAIGLFIGKVLFSQYEGKVDKVFNEKEKIYVLQQGVYSSLENVTKYTTKLDYYTVEQDDKYYRVYVAITHNKNNVDKLKNYYISKGNNIYVRELTISNPEFLELLKQYDLLLESSSGGDELSQIQKQIISKYDELVLQNEE
ncbi:MAG TPA: hypothetical protein GXZ95_01885 [Mollicutes bacterium]|nr:hypothetical protein [Mollicutes bacterium]